MIGFVHWQSALHTAISISCTVPASCQNTPDSGAVASPARYLSICRARFGDEGALCLRLLSNKSELRLHTQPC